MKQNPDLMRELLLLAADGQPGTESIERDTERHHHMLLLNDLALLSEDEGVYSVTELGKRVAAVIADDDVWSRWRDASGDLLGLVFGHLARMESEKTKTPPGGGACDVQCCRCQQASNVIESRARLTIIRRIMWLNIVGMVLALLSVAVALS